MKRINIRLKLYWRSLDLKTIGIWTLCFLGINSATAAFTVLYLNTLDNTNEVTNIENNTTNGVEFDTIGNDPFIDVGVISNSNEKLESYYAITSEGYLYTWGWNINGELGLGTTDAYVPYPTFVNLDGSFNDTNENGIKDNGEIGTITEGDKVKEVSHINKIWTNNNRINTASVFAISQEGYLYMWGDTALLFNNETSEYKYSSSKSSSQSENYISPTFVNLDNSYLENPDKTFVEEPARDIDGILYKDSSNSIIDVKIPTKTEGDKVKDISFQAYSYDNYSGVVLSESGVLYGWGKNTNKVLDYDKGVNDFVNDLTPINYGTAITDDVDYVEADLYTQNTQSTILALGDDGYLYMWGNATLIPTAVSVTDRVKIDLSDPSMSTDTSHSSKIVSYAYSPSFKSVQVINEDGYLYTLGEDTNSYFSGRGCEGGSEPFDEKFYRQDINCNGNIDDDKVKSSGITDHTSYFITEDDYLYMYGNNVSGQAGQGNESQQTTPVFVNIDGSFNDINGDGSQQSGSGEDSTKTEGDKVVLADNSNANHTLAIDKKGDLYMWGADAASGRMPKTSDDPFIRNGHNTKPIKVNFVEHEDGEKYTHSSYWNSGGIASSDYLNIYYWGSYIPGVDWTNTYELSTVYKVTKEDFITPAIKI